MPVSHEVQEGECLYSIALHYGVLPEFVWNDPANADLKKLRLEPHVLNPSDVLIIPDPRPKAESKPTDARHVFRRKGVPKELKVRFMNLDVPIRGAAYTVSIDGVAARGTTDRDGWAVHLISPGAQEAVFEFDDGEEYALSLGTLDPSNEVSGVQKRLTNLGYYEGPINGLLDEATTQALANYQLANQLEPTGRADDATEALLKSATGA